ncbi:hypothetical protein BCR35DRAFT_97053 [Leucosporidium creatinivorum]|uniref:F-box domain-containing protein n=1 Tax=Leucosporidium creatinivorum TaxID=106004 RepID=A0A1Y2F7J7_9BASI|nr:hypothetical protein BCR35DRAFT_97053 [Leucosporidium creatinivorum]
MDSVPHQPPLEAEDVSMDTIIPFPLLSLPLELIHHIVRCLDERPSSSNFPTGPSTDLLNLASVNVFFYNYCRPLVWRSIAFEAQLGAPRPEEWVMRRSLKSLAAIMRESRVVMGSGPKDEGLPADRTRSQDRLASPLPIKAFSYTSPRHLPVGLEDDDLRLELEALLDVVCLLKASKVQVLFLHGSEEGVPPKLGAALTTAILDLDSLSALRMNQMYIKGKLDLIDQAKPMPHLRTLQIMHGARKLVDITRLAPNLESLLLWPHSRGFKDLGQVIAAKLPTLRLLSLDAVHETEFILQLANTMETLISSGLSLPLEELFLEGKQTPHHRTILLTALAKVPSLKRLALYHLRDAKPQLLYEIHEVAPQLEALTLVLGILALPCSGLRLWTTTSLPSPASPS